MKRLPQFLASGLIASLCLLSPAPAKAAGQVVAFDNGNLSAGSIVVRKKERALYYVLGDGEAVRYPVAVPKSGKEWSGYARVDGKYLAPAWSPPAEVKRDNPNLPDVIPGGAPNNPMGAAALTLDRSEIAIHGTTKAMRKSIGSAASYGCIRMLNEDILELHDAVEVGTTVLMTQ
jgi:lipoprotein-anchoring transpeptidase ErfK/SrfK